MQILQLTIRFITIQPVFFHDNGSLLYPANWVYDNNWGDGDAYASMYGIHVPFKPDPNLDISPIWLPKAYFDTIVVNGNTQPKLEVAPEHYWFRILNASDSNFLNLALFMQNSKELPL